MNDEELAQRLAARMYDDVSDIHADHTTLAQQAIARGTTLRRRRNAVVSLAAVAAAAVIGGGIGLASGTLSAPESNFAADPGVSQSPSPALPSDLQASEPAPSDSPSPIDSSSETASETATPTIEPSDTATPLQTREPSESPSASPTPSESPSDPPTSQEPSTDPLTQAPSSPQGSDQPTPSGDPSPTQPSSSPSPADTAAQAPFTTSGGWTCEWYPIDDKGICTATDGRSVSMVSRPSAEYAEWPLEQERVVQRFAMMGGTGKLGSDGIVISPRSGGIFLTLQGAEADNMAIAKVMAWR